jgi:cytochrome P450 family 135
MMTSARRPGADGGALGAAARLVGGEAGTTPAMPRASAVPLPPGPDTSPAAQTVALHRDPLGVVRAARERFGPVFTLRLTSPRPLVVVADIAEARRLAEADPRWAHAGEARRRILPVASPASLFGADGEQHRAAHDALAGAFVPELMQEYETRFAAIAAEHVARWPRGRPFRLLPRVRTLVDEAFAGTIVGVEEPARRAALVGGTRRLLWTPGNPPLSLPGGGLLGAALRALYARRSRPVAAALAAEVAARRGPTANGSGPAPEGHDDAIGGLLSARPDATGEQLADELMVVVMAGQEPPSVALTSLLDRLAREPEAAEAFAAGEPDLRVVRETLRLRPPAFGVLRRLTKPAEVAGHALPAGATIAVPIPLLQHDPVAWEQPEAFRPERWADGVAERAEAEGAYLPFGGGARSCIGRPLFAAYVRSIVPEILRHLRLRPAWPREEKLVLRGTVLVPHRNAPMVATSADR